MGIKLSDVGPETSYSLWTQRYSNEDGDRIGALAKKLTEWDRQNGREAPAAGYSAARLDDAAAIVWASQEPRSPVCPRCLGLEPGKPGGAGWCAHPGPFTADLCPPCLADTRPIEVVRG